MDPRMDLVQVARERDTGRVEGRLVPGLHRRHVVFDGRAPALDADWPPFPGVLALSPLAVGAPLARELLLADRGDGNLGREVQVEPAGRRPRRADAEQVARAAAAKRRKRAFLARRSPGLFDRSLPFARDFPTAM